MLVDLTPYGLTGKAVEKLLDAAHITANKNTIPNDPEKPFVTSGIRVGTPAVTSRGFREPEMEEIAALMRIVALPDYAEHKDEVIARVEAMCRKYPVME
mgnify:CR=1 FL=1